MRTNDLITLLAAGALALTGPALTGPTHAGPLTPPPGPVAPSGPTLVQATDLDSLADTIDDIDGEADDIALFETRVDLQTVPGDADSAHVITEPGSYYLTSDLLVSTSDTNGVFIDADNVTIDLNGYEIRHTNPGSNGVSRGITGPRTLIEGSVSNLCVHNGTIRDFDFSQIDIYAAISQFRDLRLSGGNTVASLRLLGARGNMFIGVRVDNNASADTGIQTGLTASWGGVMAECHVSNCGNGMSASNGFAVRDCSFVGGTGGGGITLSSGAVLTRTLVFSTPGQGIVSVGLASVISHCNVQFAGTNGFNLADTIAYDSHAKTSGLDGFRLFDRNYVYQCSAIDSDDKGFNLEFNGNRVEACHAATVSGIPANNGFFAAQSANGNFVVRNTAANAFDTFSNTSVNISIFADDWFNILLAGPWDNLSQ